MDSPDSRDAPDVAPAKDSAGDELPSTAWNGNQKAHSFYFIPKEDRKRQLPTWLDHFKAEDLKLVVKASLAVWLMTILIFIDPARQAIGQATFFGCVVLFFVPPVGVVFMHLLGSVTVIIGACLGWAWGAITMEAALATRPAADLAARYKELQQLAIQSVPNATPAAIGAYSSNAISNGYFLDARVTATYFCMMGLFIYLVARMRVAAPKLTLVSIFALVVSIVYLTTGPLLPSFNGTLPSLFIYPVGVAIVIGFICNVLIFPQSTSSIIRNGARDTLAPMKGFVEALAFHLANPSSRMVLDRVAEVQATVIKALQTTEAAKTFLPMDFTTGRWSPEDIASLSQPIREVVFAFGQLLQYQKQREENRAKKDKLLMFYNEEQEKPRLRVGHHQISRAVGLYEEMNHPNSQALIEESLKGLARPGKDILEKVNEAIDAVNEALGCSDKRVHEADLVEEHNNALESLKEAQSVFMEKVNQTVTDPYSNLFDEDGYLIQNLDDSRPPPIAGLITGILFQENINNLATAVANLLQRTTELERERGDRYFWPPRGLRRIFAWSLDRETVPTAVQNPAALRKNPTTDKEGKGSRRKRGKKHPKATDSLAPQTAEDKLNTMKKPTSRPRHKSSQILVAVVDWLTNTEGLYALRVLIITVALTIPSAIPSSTAFYRRETALWAAIMGQLGVMPYAADFVYSSLLKSAGTVAGGVIGLVCWYIGAGSGIGNPYGMAAIMAVAIVAFIWLRLFLNAKHLQTVVVTVSTVYLVVAYSWTTSRNPANSSAGVGYTLFWRRILLSLIGVGAAAVVMFFPKPPSGNRHCRSVLAECFGGIKDRYVLFVSTWKDPPEDLRSVIEKEAIANEEVLAALDPQIKTLGFEFSTSNFDSHTLGRVACLCGELNRSMTRMMLCLPHLEPEARERFMRNSGAGEETVTMELIAVLTLVQQVLMSGDPLPALMSTPLIQRSFMFLDKAKKQDGMLQITRMQLIESSGRRYVSAVGAYIQFLFSIEELVIEVKKAVGETGDVDIEK